MSNSIGVRFAAIVAVGAALLGLAAVSAAAQAPPEPAPVLSIAKEGKASGSEVVYFTITVTNVGNSQTEGEVLIQDSLSDDAYWFILGAQLSDGEDSEHVSDACKLIPGNPAGATLLCQINAPILGKHLNEDKDEFVYGSVSVHVYGIARHCGEIPNTAWYLYGTTIKSASASATAPCPATPTPTPTSTPTATPTLPPSTPTPIIVVVTATPSPTATPTLPRVAPKPPNTGDSTLTHDSNRSGAASASWIYGGLIVLGTTLAIGGAAAARRSRR